MDTGYNIHKRNDKDKFIVNHLFYMDDLKLYNSRQEDLKRQIRTVHRFSNDIGMEFGLDKCAKISIIKGKHQPTDDIEIDHNKHIKELDRDEQYKYLGIIETIGLNHKEMRQRLTKEYYYRLKKILRINLNPKNKITAINQLAVPVLQYTFGIINWPQNAIDPIDVKTRKLLTIHKVFYKLQCHARLYLPRSKGGMGLININYTHRATTVSMARYLTTSTQQHIKEVARHEQDKPDNVSLTKLSTNFKNQIQIADDPEEIETRENPSTKKARKTRKNYMKKVMESYEQDWENNERAGKMKIELDKEHVDKEGSLKWLRRGVLNYDGERIMMAAQDQGLVTRATLHLFDNTVEQHCRFCRQGIESPAHLLSQCEIMRNQKHYTTRHNKVCSNIHWNLLGTFNIHRSTKHWEHEPARVTTTGEIDIFYDREVELGSFIENRATKPDIIIHNKRTKQVQILEVGITSDTGITFTTNRKVNKYTDFKKIMTRE